MKTSLSAAVGLAALALALGACQAENRPAEPTAPAAAAAAADSVGDTADAADSVVTAPADAAVPTRNTNSRNTQPRSQADGSDDGMNPDGAVNAHSPPPIIAPDPSVPPPPT